MAILYMSAATATAVGIEQGYGYGYGYAMAPCGTRLEIDLGWTFKPLSTTSGAMTWYLLPVSVGQFSRPSVGSNSQLAASS